MRRLLLSTCVSVASFAASGCRANGGGSSVKDDNAPSVDDSEEAAHAVTGYDLNGKRTCKPLPAGHACAESAGGAQQVVDQCLAIGGKTKYCSDCSELCDRPLEAAVDCGKMPDLLMCCQAMIPACMQCGKDNAAKMKAWKDACHLALGGETCRDDAVGPQCFKDLTCVPPAGAPISEHTAGTCQSGPQQH